MPSEPCSRAQWRVSGAGSFSQSGRSTCVGAVHAMTARPAGLQRYGSGNVRRSTRQHNAGDGRQSGVATPSQTGIGSRHGQKGAVLGA